MSGLVDASLLELAPKVRPGSSDVCKKGCKLCQSLQDTKSLLRLVGENSTDQLSKLVLHFLQVNSHDLSESWKFSAALNLAFASKVF